MRPSFFHPAVPSSSHMPRVPHIPYTPLLSQPQTLYGSAPGLSRRDVSSFQPPPIIISSSHFPQQSFSSLLPSHPPHARAHHRPNASTSDVPTTNRYRSMLDIHTPLPALPPAPQIPEEDECPICHSELPPKGPDGSEAAREAHVSQCIETHFSSSAPRTRHPPPTAAVAAAVAASAATPAEAGSSVGGRPALENPPAGSELGRSTAVGMRRRTTGMVVYHASEKDCVGEEGRAQECVICFEEFAVGDEMGRLECLCKFHKVCWDPPLRDWGDGEEGGQVGGWVHGTEESWSSGNAADWKCRCVYGSGGIRRVRGRVRCIRVVFESKILRVASGVEKWSGRPRRNGVEICDHYLAGWI